jgi:hypothetical protein
MPLLLVSLPVLLKYPAFVYLLIDPQAEAKNPAGVLVLVYACFVAYECLHDERLWTERGTTTVLVLALVAMAAAAALLMFEQTGGWWSASALAAGCAVLVELLRWHRQHTEPGLWPYSVFLVGCFWIALLYPVPTR